jgi:ATP-dependent helicase YprA (DUF1998 family)
VLAGKNVVLAAETGSGKTLAYLAPVVEAVLRRRAAEGVVHGEDAAPSSDDAVLSSVAVGREWPTAQVPPERCGTRREVMHWTAHRAQGCGSHSQQKRTTRALN